MAAERDLEEVVPKLPADFIVEVRGTGEFRHVFLSIEGSEFELHPVDALPLGKAIVRAAEEAAKDDGGAE